MTILPILPFLVPLAAAALCLAAWRIPAAQRAVSLSASALGLAASAALLVRVHGQGIQVLRLGNWPAPFGIVLAVDLFAAIMAVMAALMGFCVNVYTLGGLDRERETAGFHPLYQMLLAGVAGAFLTGDLFNLYVMFEVMLISSFALIALGAGKRQTGGAIKYVALNLLSSVLFLISVGLLYRITGTLNMAELASTLGEGPASGAVTALSLLFLVAFGIKAAVFPLFFWLPDSYPTLPVPVAAIFAGLLTKVGVYALVRMFTLVFVQEPGLTHSLLLVLAAATMITGVLGAAANMDVRRILSFHIISQVGYMVMGLGLFTPLALAGTVFYIFHHIIVKTNLFLVGGILRRHGGSFALADLGGMLRSSPGTALLFLVPALSLAGLPPLSGFMAKFLLIKAGLEAGRPLLVGASLAVGLLTLFSMTKIWNEAFWKDAPAPDPGRTRAAPGSGHGPWRTFALWFPSCLLAGLTLAIGIGSEWAYGLSRDAARQLLDRRGYITAVLGGS